MSHLIALTWAVAELGAATDALTRLGFDVETGDRGASLSAGEVTFELEVGEKAGLTAWAFSGPVDEHLRFDPTTLPPTALRAAAPGSEHASARHPNGVSRVDHVVAMVPRLATTVAGLEEYVGAECRKRGEVKGMPAAFLRAGEVILEVVEVRTLTGPRLWGVAFVVDDCDATVAAIRDRDGDVTDPAAAIQGGRIAQCPGEVAGATIAFMEPSR